MINSLWKQIIPCLTFMFCLGSVSAQMEKGLALNGGLSSLMWVRNSYPLNSSFNYHTTIGFILRDSIAENQRIRYEFGVSHWKNTFEFQSEPSHAAYYRNLDLSLTSLKLRASLQHFFWEKGGNSMALFGGVMAQYNFYEVATGNIWDMRGKEVVNNLGDTILVFVSEEQNFDSEKSEFFAPFQGGIELGLAWEKEKKKKGKWGIEISVFSFLTPTLRSASSGAINGFSVGGYFIF